MEVERRLRDVRELPDGYGRKGQRRGDSGRRIDERRDRLRRGLLHHRPPPQRRRGEERRRQVRVPEPQEHLGSRGGGQEGACEQRTAHRQSSQEVQEGLPHIDVHLLHRAAGVTGKDAAVQVHLLRDDEGPEVRRGQGLRPGPEGCRERFPQNAEAARKELVDNGHAPRAQADESRARRPAIAGRRRRRSRRFLRPTLQSWIQYAITKGQKFGPALDFAPLPKVVLKADEKAAKSL